MGPTSDRRGFARREHLTGASGGESQRHRNLARYGSQRRRNSTFSETEEDLNTSLAFVTVLMAGESAGDARGDQTQPARRQLRQAAVQQRGSQRRRLRMD